MHNLQKKHCGYSRARLDQKSLFGCRTICSVAAIRECVCVCVCVRVRTCVRACMRVRSCGLACAGQELKQLRFDQVNITDEHLCLRLIIILLYRDFEFTFYFTMQILSLRDS